MNVMELSARLSLDAKGFEKGIKSAESRFKSFGSRLSSIGGKIVKGLSVATAAASAGFVALGKNAVNAYAQYEQLVGGVETLFKDSAGQLQKYADVSYKTAGVSANRFMEMSTSFAAALVQGLGGDTARAADMANTAIIDMSDNANKMGTDMAMLQNAYQGFAKSNFTMLDNLKIGYGGTKTEMERLLSDAEKLTGKKYDVSNFADIVDAIHAIQTQMGITGTTAKEAENTISGSMNMVKAAWEDMLVAMSKPQEVTEFFGNIQDESDATAKSIQKGPQEATRRFANSVKTMLGNVLPTVRNFLNGFGEVVAEIAPIIGEELPQLLADFAPKLLEAGKNLVVGLGKGITKAFQKFKWPTWKDVQSGAQKAWQGIQKGVEWLGGLVFGTDPKTGGVKWPTWATVKEAAQKAWNVIREKALHMVGALAFGTDEKGQVNWPDWDEDTTGLEKVWDTIKAVAAKAGETFGALVFGRNEDTGAVEWPTWDGITTGAKNLWEKAKAVAADAVNQFGAFVFGKDGDTGEVKWPTWDGVTKGADDLWKQVKGYASSLGGLVFGRDGSGKVNWPKLSFLKLQASALWNSIVSYAKTLKGLVFGDTTNAAELFENIKTKWTELKTTIEQGAINIATYFFDEADPATVSSAISTIGDAIKIIGSAIATYFVVDKVRQLGTAIGHIRTLFTLGTTKAGNFLSENKVALILSGIAAAMMLVYEHWDEIEPVLTRIGEWVNTNIIEPFQKGIDTVTQFFAKVREALGLGGSGTLSETQVGKLQELFMNGGGKTTDNFVAALREEMEKAGYTADEIEKTINTINNADSPLWVLSFLDNLSKTQSVLDAVKATVEAIGGKHDIDYYVHVHGAGADYSNGGRSDSLTGFGGSRSGAPGAAHNTVLSMNAKGSWNVPYDNMPALLHRNEMVLTATQARQYREGRGGSLDAATLAQAMRSAVLDLTMELNGEAVGRVFGDQTTRRVNHNISQINRRHRYGYGG